MISVLPTSFCLGALMDNTLRRRITLGLTAAALVAGGGVAIAAGQPDTDSGPTSEATTTAKPAPGKRAIALGGGVLHSESVVSDGQGGFVTHLVQLGEIESVDDTALTVVSEDGYQRSWVRNDDTAIGQAGWSVTKNDDGSFTVRKDDGELATGQKVLVLGTLDGETATASRIAARPDVDGELPDVLRKRFGGEGMELGGDLKGMLKDRLMKRFEGRTEIAPGRPMFGAPGGEVRKFQFKVPGEAAPRAGTRVAPEPATEPATEPAPSSSAGATVQPSSLT